MARITKKIREAIYAFDPQMWKRISETLPRPDVLAPTEPGQCINKDNTNQLKLF